MDVATCKNPEFHPLAYQESEEMFKGLATAAQDGIILIDEKEKISYWNRAAENLFNYSAAEIIGKKMPMLFTSAKDAAAYRKELRHFSKLGAAETPRKLLTLQAVKKDGSKFPVELTVSALQLKGVWHAVSILRDVAERTGAEAKLRRSERNLIRAQEIAHIGSWRWDIVDDQIMWSHGSAEAYRIFGFFNRRRNLSFDTFLQAVHPEDRDRVRETVDDALADGKRYDIDHRIVLPDGSVQFVQEQAEVILDDSGKAIGVEGTVHDITSRKLSEEMLQRQLEQMTALNDIAIAISSSLDIRITLNVLLERLTSLLKVDAAAVLLLDKESLYLNFAAGRGFWGVAAQSTHVRLGKGHAGQAAYNREARVITDFSTSGTSALQGEKFVAYIAMPLISKGQVRGVLEIFQRKPLDQTKEWMNFLELLAGQAAIAIDNAAMVEGLERSATELTLSYDATLEGWGRTLEFRDEDTKGHTERVAERSLQLARLMGLADPELVQVRRGALLHDIGKISISDSILLKPGPLTTEEQVIMQRHTTVARDLLSSIPFLRPAIDIPYCHHERWDGQGYPRGLREEDIPFKARIFAIVDVADALISDRPYRLAWPVEKTYQHLASLKGSHFDPIVVEAFLDMKWSMPSGL